MCLSVVNRPTVHLGAVATASDSILNYYLNEGKVINDILSLLLNIKCEANPTQIPLPCRLSNTLSLEYISINHTQDGMGRAAISSSNLPVLPLFPCLSDT